jgi:sugar phosphate isomerase/epimerase
MFEPMTRRKKRMTEKSDVMPLGVFTSIGAGLGAGIEAVKTMGVPTVQVHAPPPEMRTAEYAKKVKDMFDRAGIAITLVFCGFPGESYASIPVVRQTVGLVPPATREDRIEQTRVIADFAAALGAPGIGIHIGFVDEDTKSKDFDELVHVAKGLCDYCSALGLRMHLETGQETADTLLAFLKAVDRPNIAVNFDPANMILYGSGEPIPALKKVGKYVKSCHCKDAKWAAKPGEEWGVETPLGEGDVNIEKFLATLIKLGYTGPLTIEREISGPQQTKDIKKAIDLLNALKAKLL